MTTVVKLHNNKEYTVYKRTYDTLEELPSLVMVHRTPTEVMLIQKASIKEIKSTRNLMDFM